MQISRKDLAHIIEARVEEIFDLVIAGDQTLRLRRSAAGRHGADRRQQSALPGITRTGVAKCLACPSALPSPENLFGSGRSA
ncbi:MAG: hypothetical protein M0C28_44535 [Candidatus Moduliflexus flocculans]|nr:hypothetical protein [Candidatus Moduliflexus flocculans]